MKKILIGLTCLTLLSVISVQKNTEVENFIENDITESTLDFVNQKNGIETKRLNELSGELSYSKMFTQYAFNKAENAYYLRFVTAVKGDVSKLTYTRTSEGLDTNTKESTVLYAGISAEGTTYYYNDAEKDTESKGLTTNEAYKGNYYWSTYTIKFAGNSVNKIKEMNVSLDIDGTKVEASQTLDTLIAEDRNIKFETFDIVNENDKVYYLASGTCFGYDESELSHDLAGYTIEDQTVTIDYEAGTFLFKTDITNVTADNALLYPHLYFRGEKHNVTGTNSYDIKDSDYSSNGKGVIYNGLSYKIVCNSNQSYGLPSVAVRNSEQSFAFNEIGLKLDGTKVLYYIKGTSTGYLNNEITFSIRNPLTDVSHSKFNITRDHSNNTFEITMDVTDFGATGTSDAQRGQAHFAINNKGMGTDGKNLPYTPVNTETAIIYNADRSLKYSIIKTWNTMAGLQVEKNLELQTVNLETNAEGKAVIAFEGVTGYRNGDTLPVLNLGTNTSGLHGAKTIDNAVITIDEETNKVRYELDISSIEYKKFSNYQDVAFFAHLAGKNIANTLTKTTTYLVANKKEFKLIHYWDTYAIYVSGDFYLDVARNNVTADLYEEDGKVYYTLTYKGFLGETTTIRHDLVGKYITAENKAGAATGSLDLSSLQQVIITEYDEHYDLITLKTEVSSVVATAEEIGYWPHLYVNEAKYGKAENDATVGDVRSKDVSKTVTLNGVQYKLQAGSYTPSWKMPILRIKTI